MGTVSRVHTFSSGAILTAAQLNNEFDNLLTSSAINGGLDATNLGVTAGQATASKALVVDSSRNLADGTAGNRINNLALSGTLESTGLITATAGITSGSNIVSDTDSTDDLGTTGVRWRNLYVDDVTVTNNVSIGGTLTLTGGLTLNGNVAIGDSASDTLTVNSTITSNLIFTDATYDIGASGATRPRDLHLSRNALMGGTLGVTGLLTATAGVTSGSNIVSDTDGTDDLGLTGTRWRYVYADDIAITNDLAVTEGGTGASTASAARTNLGLGSIATQASDSVSITGGSITGITDITVSDGGTGASNASNARTNLGLAIGSDIQAYDAGLADIAGLATSDGNIIVGSGSNWVAESGATARTSLGLGSIATQNANAVSISGGSLTGMTSYSGGSFSGTTGAFSGNVTISKDAPQLIMTDSGSGGGTSDIIIDAIGSNHGFYFRADGATNHVILESNGDFKVNADTLFVDASASAVGVGTSSPSGLGQRSLNVKAPSSSGADLTIEADNGTNFGVFFSGATASDPFSIFSNTGFKFAIASDKNATGFAEALRIKSDGTVGIGTSSPTQKLHVLGDVLIDTGTTSTLYFDADTNWMQLISGDFRWGLASAEKMRLTADGDLLIGETSDQIARVYATTSTVGDYAFIGVTTGADRGPLSTSNTSASFNDILHSQNVTAAYSGSNTFRFLQATSSTGSTPDTQFLLRGDGEAYADGSWNGSGADYQEYFESASGEAAEVGRAIVLDSDRVRYYNADTDSTDDIMGVTRPQADNKNSAVVGNVAWNHWTDKYETDDWGVYLREDVTVWTHINEKGEDFAVYERDELAKDSNWTPPEGATSSTQSVRKLNPDFNKSLDATYESREVRDEWWLIGLLGQIQVKAGEPVNPRWIKMKNISDAVELYYVR
jgi:hypothetical protein